MRMTLRTNPQKRAIAYIIFAIVIVFLFLLVLARVCGFTPGQQGYRRISTRIHLMYARGEIREFKSITGRWPDSLREIQQYARDNPDAELNGGYFVEFLSKQKGNRTEHSVLNGEGGLYYNRTTGELRINLTNELHHYLPLIRGKERKDVPAKW